MAKQITMYEIREFNGNSYSRLMSHKLRDRSQASKLVKRLKKMGHKDAFASKMKITK